MYSTGTSKSNLKSSQYQALHFKMRKMLCCSSQFLSWLSIVHVQLWFSFWYWKIWLFFLLTLKLLWKSFVSGLYNLLPITHFFWQTIRFSRFQIFNICDWYQEDLNFGLIFFLPGPWIGLYGLDFFIKKLISSNNSMKKTWWN